MTLRDDHWLALAAFVLFLGIGSCLNGCGPSFKQIQAQYDSAADACVSQAQQLERDCPRGDECVTKLHELRTRCDVQLNRICHQSRRAERVCP